MRGSIAKRLRKVAARVAKERSIGEAPAIRSMIKDSWKSEPRKWRRRRTDGSTQLVRKCWGKIASMEE